MPIQFDFHPKKAIAAIRFLAECEVPDLTKEKANKLIFLADKAHLVRFARPITGSTYAALPHGPVPSQIDNLLDELEADQISSANAQLLASEVCLDRRFRYPRLVARGTTQTAIEQLSPSDISVFREILKRFSGMDFSQLRAITHEMPAYERAWESRTGNRGWMKFEDLFEEDENAVLGALEEATENWKIRSQFPEPCWD